MILDILRNSFFIFISIKSLGRDFRDATCLVAELEDQYFLNMKSVTNRCFHESVLLMLSSRLFSLYKPLLNNDNGYG